MISIQHETWQPPSRFEPLTSHKRVFHSSAHANVQLDVGEQVHLLNLKSTLLKNICWIIDGNRSSVDSTGPTILRPRVRIPSTTSTLFSIVGPWSTESPIDRMGIRSTFTERISLRIDRRWHLLKNSVKGQVDQSQEVRMELRLIDRKKFPTRFPKQKTACYVTDETNITNVIEF